MAFPMIPDASFDGGDLDCGNGLLILIRQHLGPLERGQLLHLRSTDKSVAEDLPSWSRLTGNDLLEYRTEGTGLETVHHFLVVKGSLSERKVRLEEKIAPKPVLPGVANPIGDRVVPLPPRDQLIPGLPKLAVFGIGSMPRPAWLLRMLHEKLEGRITEEEFENAADDAVR